MYLPPVPGAGGGVAEDVDMFDLDGALLSPDRRPVPRGKSIDIDLHNLT